MAPAAAANPPTAPIRCSKVLRVIVMNAPIRQNAGLQFIHLRGRRMFRAWQDEFDPKVEIVHSIRLADLLCNAAKLNERSEVIRNKLRITRSKP
jgi:hypothetical protein